MANEVELKLSFPPTALPSIEAHPLVLRASSHGVPEVLESTYFDTPELKLHAAKVAVRTRKTANGLLQTIKCAAASVGGLSCRPEWEQSFDDQFDFSNIEALGVRHMLEEVQGDLLPVFMTVFHRQTRLAEPRRGVRILIMIDSGHVITGADKAPISEVELELVEGNPSDLQDFAIQLASDLPLLPFDQSKAERGYQLFAEQMPRPVKAGKPQLDAALSPIAAFVALATREQACWQANLHGALASENPEFVHQYRVALRRLGTLLRIFKPLLPKSFSAYWTNEFKRLAGVTGEIRDLDVMSKEILQPMLCSESDDAGAGLVKLAQDCCAKDHRQAEAALGNLFDGVPLLRFIRDINALADQQVDNIQSFAESRVARLHLKAVKRFTAVVKDPTPAAAHRFRIALKHLRYACEFFANLFDEAQMSQYAKDVAGLQDELGFLNDLHVAMLRLEQWCRDDAAMLAVRDHVVAWHAGRADKKLAIALGQAESLLGQCQPWCGECDRRCLGSIRKRLRQGVSLKLV
ncbi:MAG: CHAD domain-containing protein [Rhodocyclales bacterium GT-UBC]|nr:MAG: CHAD domain-containing protein [Rhodocyclales bacterium GT-UBC]